MHIDINFILYPPPKNKIVGIVESVMFVHFNVRKILITNGRLIAVLTTKLAQLQFYVNFHQKAVLISTFSKITYKNTFLRCFYWCRHLHATIKNGQFTAGF